MKLSSDLIRKNIPNTPALEDNIFVTYVALSIEKAKAHAIGEKYFFTSPTMLSYAIYDMLNVNHKINDNISANFKLLLQQTNIDCEATSLKGYYRVRTGSVDFDKIVNSDQPFYTVIPIDSIRKICQSKYVERNHLLRYYCFLMSFVMGKQDKSQVAFMTYGTIHNFLGYSNNTINNYNKKLKELQVVEFYDKHLSTGSEHYKGNVFAEWSSRFAIPIYIEENYPKCKHIEKKGVAERKSLKMKFRNLEKGKVYDDDTMKKIYKYAVDSNKYNQDIIEDIWSTEAQIKKAKSRLLDMSVFGDD